MKSTIRGVLISCERSVMNSSFFAFHRQYLAAFSVSLLPLCVMAESGQNSTDELESVVVTASRYDADQPGAQYSEGRVSTGGRLGVMGKVDAYEAPFNLFRFNKQALEEEQVDSISDIASMDAGVQTYMGYGNFSEQFQIRGFNLHGEDVAYGGMYGVLPRQIVLTDIAESIEIFKGASAFANGVAPGGTGVGGSINIEPKYAGDEDETQVGLSYQNNTYLSAQVDSGRRFGTDDALGVRLSGVFGQGSTAIEDESRSNGSAYLGLDYETDSSHTFFNAGYQQTDIDEGRSTVYIGTGLTDIPDAPESNTNYKTDWTYFEAENLFGILRHEQNLTDNWLGYAAIGGNKTSEMGAYSSPTLNSTDGSATVSRLDVAYEAQSMTGQLGLEGQFATGDMLHQLNLGYSGLVREFGFGSAGSSANLNTNIYDPAYLAHLDTDNGPVGTPDLNNKTMAHGVALSDSIDALDGLINATLGLRYQQIKTSSGDNEYDGDALSPVVGVAYHPTDAWTVYGNYVEALQEGETAPSGADNAGDNIGLKRSRQFEIGTKVEGQQMGATLSLYQIQQPSAFQNDDGDYGYHGEQRSRGLELSVYGDPIDRLHLLSSFAVTDAVLTETDSGTNEGNQVIGVPQYSLVLGANYDLTARFNVSSRLIHTGSQYADNANKLELDSWTRLDMGASYDTVVASLPLTVQGNIENVTNADYWASAAGGYLTQGVPLTAKLSGTLSF